MPGLRRLRDPRRRAGVHAELGIPPERIVFVTGIGCAGRFAYYMNTYGMHGIHGRAPALATGLAAARDDLSIWIVTGDGDALSIGGNHLIHALRRNVPIKILLFNNQIYGLTKGQASPTVELGKVTKSTPFGSLDTPFNPLALALGAGATFVARTLDTDKQHLPAMLRAAAEHQGAALVEIFQNCPVFNDGAFDSLADKQHARAATDPARARRADPLRARPRAGRRARRRRRPADRRGRRRRRGRDRRPRRPPPRPEPRLRARRGSADRRTSRRRSGSSAPSSARCTARRPRRLVPARSLTRPCSTHSFTPATPGRWHRRVLGTRSVLRSGASDERACVVGIEGEVAAADGATVRGDLLRKWRQT